MQYRVLRLLLFPILLPVSWIYRLVILCRNKCFDWGVFSSSRYNFPVISVGNITVGGTGKTPHTEHLLRVLSAHFQTATLSRGYKRKTKGWQLASADSKAEEVGDEPLQIKKKFPQTHVGVDANRRSGIIKLRELKPQPEVIVLDDAYQHRKVTPSISILLVDYNRPIDGDRMLPLGNLREPAYQKKRAGIILVTKCPRDLEPIEQRIFLKELNPYPYQKVYFTTYSYSDLVPVFPRRKKSLPKKYIRQLARDKKVAILLVTGIATPEPMMEYIKYQMGGDIYPLIFPDHHDYQHKDFKKIMEAFEAMEGDEKFVITTEKDAMRLHKFCNIAGPLLEAIYYLPIRVRFLEKAEEKFNQQVITYVRENRVHSFLHPKQGR